MLFLNTKNVVAVLALGSLLSVNSRVQAVTSPISLRDGLALAAAGGTLWAATHKIDHTKKDKALHVKALDTSSGYVQKALNFVTSKDGLTAAGGALAAFLVVKHGRDVVNLPVVNWALSWVTMGSGAGASAGASKHHHHNSNANVPASQE